MKIGILGWGSLIWNPGNLKLMDKWREDGPSLPIEFARISNDGRITLVITESSKPVQVLWNVLDTNSLEEARNMLKEREKTPNLNRIGFINLITNEQQSKKNEVANTVSNWAKKTELDSVIWTDLGVKFQDQLGFPLNIENIKQYLGNLDQMKFSVAIEYILNTPKQIQTDYRFEIEKYISKMNK